MTRLLSENRATDELTACSMPSITFAVQRSVPGGAVAQTYADPTCPAIFGCLELVARKVLKIRMLQVKTSLFCLRKTHDLRHLADKNVLRTGCFGTPGARVRCLGSRGRTCRKRGSHAPAISPSWRARCRSTRRSAPPSVPSAASNHYLLCGWKSGSM